MILLGFDTCLDKMYIALCNDSDILESKIVTNTNEHYHSAFLISNIRNILKNNNLTPQNIDAIAINIGPGSFTGIRACATVSRVFSQGTAAKTIGVSSLEIIANINKTAQKTLVAMDARKGMAYIAIYEDNIEILKPQAVMLDEVKRMILNNDYFVITDNSLEPILGGISYQKIGDNLGEYLIKIAKQRLSSGAETDWKKLHPLYIMPPSVTMKKNC